MKHAAYCLLSIILLSGVPTLAATEQNEIIIEMTGSDTNTAPSSSVWDKNAEQLMRLFRGKDKNYVLQTVDSISAQEQTITSSGGESYILVQYGQDTRDYRKFLFHSKSPQTLVTCSATAADTVAIFQQYGVNLGFRKADFLASYPKLQAPAELPNGSSFLTVYTLPAEQLPLSAKQPLFVIFEHNRLVQLCNGAEALETYKKTLKPAPVQQTQPSQNPAPVATKKQKKPYKALLSGGTLNDQMYMPHVVSGPFTPTTNPKSTASY